MPVPKGTRFGGKPKGYKAPQTIEKEIERERVRQLVCAEVEPMTLAQIASAKGIKYLVTRSKASGKFIRVTEAMARVKHGALPPDGLEDLAQMVVQRGTLSDKDLPLLSSLLREWHAAKLALQAHADDEEIIEVWEKDPNIQAYADLMNRALDKPAEQVKVTGADDGPIEHVFRWGTVKKDSTKR